MYLKHTPSIIQYTSNILQTIELKKKQKYTSSLSYFEESSTFEVHFVKLVYHFNVNLKYTSNALSILKVYFLQVYIKYTLSILQSHFTSILQVYFTKITMPFQGSFVSMDHFMDRGQMSAESQWGLIFNQQFLRNSWYSLDWPLKDERLMQFFSYNTVLNLGPLVSITCALTTRPLFLGSCIFLPVFCLVEIELYLKHNYVL